MSKEIKNAGDWLGFEPETTARDGGLKYDKGKPMMALIPMSVLEGLARVYELGARKYGYLNWTKFEPTEENRLRFASAMIRHYANYQSDPHGNDSESNLPHIDHVIWNAVMLKYLSE